MQKKLLTIVGHAYAYIPLQIGLLTCIIIGMQVYNIGIFGDPDSPYHLSIAKNFSLWPRDTVFYWLPFTSWGSAFADQHYLFHVFLKPFTLVHLEQAATVLGFLANLLTFNWLLALATKSQRTPWLWLYVLGSTDLLVRTNIIKAETTGMVFLFLLTGILLQQRWVWLFPIMSLYMLWYGGSTIFLLILGIYCAIASIYQRTLVLQPVLYTLCGMLLALAIHPYRTTLPGLLYDQITAAGFLRHIPGGNEWYAHPAAFMKDNISIFLPWLAGLFYFVLQKKSRNLTTWFYVSASIILLCTGLFTTRILIYWVPCAILACASILAEPLWKYVQNVFKNSSNNLTKKLLYVAGFCILVRLMQNVYGISTAIHTIGMPANRLKQAAEWLLTHTQPGDIITNSSWSLFPELLYWNTQNRYIAGADPAFLWLGDTERYTQWSSLQNTSITPQAYALVLRALNSRWVIVPTTNMTLTNNAYFEQMYEDREVRILQLKK